MPQPQLDFLDVYILEMLKRAGVGELTENNRATYLPQFRAEVEYRLGLALLPRLNEKQAKQYARLLGEEKIDEKKWAGFWQSAVPDYDVILTRVLVEFAQECKKILDK